MGNGRGEHVTHFCVPTPRCESSVAFLFDAVYSALQSLGPGCSVNEKSKENITL